MHERFGGILILSVFLGLLLGFAPRPAYACSCAGGTGPVPDQVRAELQSSSMVFSGRVVGIEDRQSGVSVLGFLFGGATYGRAVTFEVAAVWKGTPRSRVVVHTGWGGGDCGVGFQVGESYLVYAGEAQDELRTSICTRTADLTYAQADLAVLGPGTVPSPSLSPWLWVAVTCLGPLLVLLGVGLFVFVRRRRRARLLA
jgi:hypothetical protein